jgi:hypothetical protein
MAVLPCVRSVELRLDAILAARATRAGTPRDGRVCTHDPSRDARQRGQRPDRTGCRRRQWPFDPVVRGHASGIVNGKNVQLLEVDLRRSRHDAGATRALRRCAARFV